MKTKFKTILNFTAAIATVTLTLSSCVDDLNTLPLDKNIQTTNNVLTNDSAYLQLLAKCYSGLAVGGQTANDGAADISSIGGGYSSYFRQYWCAQELTTDEAICAWNDGNLRDYHDQDWNASNELVQALYYRINLEISYCNNLIRLTKGNEKYKDYYTEARFLRAMSYWHMLDLFHTGPFVTENDKVGFFFPNQASSQELFDYIESELKDIENVLVMPRTNEYGRADRAAAWMVLAKLYLNAKVYTGTEKYTDCITYSNKIIAAGYVLESKYANLFLADNNLRTNEIIFPICFDGRNTQTWGGCTYLICAAVGDGMNASDFGIAGGWGGNRTTSAFVNKFPDITGTTDKRAMFYTNNHTLEINDIFSFKQGYALGKYKNITSTGAVGSSTTFPDTDVPLFRLSDAYLMYAEAVLRGGSGGTRNLALEYVNKIRERAYNAVVGDPAADITDAQLTLDFILDERARELYWEGQRRTDLIRFDKFTGSNYIWPWKGAVKEGKSTDSKYNVLPIPSSDINANPKLKQTAGYF
ncbi:MAG TPA: RagB/SusD family nutrient uptake outer membrane protein [Paludibacter sp.]|nr:RagB/SusD family nutrient uptake outer membrane protein [Paludibacter sp.]